MKIFYKSFHIMNPVENDRVDANIFYTEGKQSRVSELAAFSAHKSLTQKCHTSIRQANLVARQGSHNLLVSVVIPVVYFQYSCLHSPN